MSTSAHDRMYTAVASFPAQFDLCEGLVSTALVKDLIPSSQIDEVTVCAMGGSAFPCEILREAIKGELRVHIHRDYFASLHRVERNHLYILSSFSGNTEEVLDCAVGLHRLGATICVVTNGGRLADWAKAHDVVKLSFPDTPSNFQPRCATGYFLGLLTRLLDALELTRDCVKRFRDATNVLARSQASIEADADALARTLCGNSVVMFGSHDMMSTAGQIGRIKLNENSKILVHVGTLPEFNHNQMEAVVRVGGADSLAVIALDSPLLTQRQRQRHEVTCSFLREAGANVFEIGSISGDWLSHCLSSVWLLDFASLLVAAMHEVDPESIEGIESFKRLMGP